MRVFDNISKTKGSNLKFHKLEGTDEIVKTHPPREMDVINNDNSHKIKGRTHIHTTCFWTHDEVRKPTERECLCRGRFADRQRCSSQAFRSRESIVERTDGSSGRRNIIIKACGIDVQGTFPRACHIVLPRTRCTESQV